MSENASPSPEDQAREIRGLRWRLKQLGKQCGRQGETIYRLRCEVAALREAVQWSPGDRARMLEQLRHDNALLRTVTAENARLRDALMAQRAAGGAPASRTAGLVAQGMSALVEAGVVKMDESEPR